MKIETGTSFAAFAQNVNRSLAAKQETKRTAEGELPWQKGGRTDSVTISAQGRANSLLETLMQQKQSLLDSKKELVKNTLETGGSLDNIKEQLQSYQEQLEAIDQQIAETMTGEIKDKVEKEKNDEQKPNDMEPKTKEEAQSQQLSSIVSVDGDLTRLKTMTSAKAVKEGRMRVLQSEIARDGIHVTPEKLKRLSKVKDEIGDLSDTIGKAVSDTNESVQESASTAAQPKEESAGMQAEEADKTAPEQQELNS